MDSPHSSIVEKENILEQALRTYEESERSLKSICNTVEQDNIQLENQLKNLQNHQKTLIKQYHLLKERFHHIQDEYDKLNEKQTIFNQQTKIISQRYEQIQLALKKILSSSLLTNENISEETYSLLGFKLIPINKDNSICSSTKRKLNYENKQNKKKNSLID